MTRAYERLLRYAAIDTGSDETSEVTPSSPGQIVLADKLAEELRELGVSDVYVDRARLCLRQDPRLHRV